MTRNVTQNTRPSFHFSGEGSGDETTIGDGLGTRLGTASAISGTFTQRNLQTSQFIIFNIKQSATLLSDTQGNHPPARLQADIPDEASSLN